MYDQLIFIIVKRCKYVTVYLIIIILVMQTDLPVYNKRKNIVRWLWQSYGGRCGINVVRLNVTRKISWEHTHTQNCKDRTTRESNFKVFHSPI